MRRLGVSSMLGVRTVLHDIWQFFGGRINIQGSTPNTPAVVYDWQVTEILHKESGRHNFLVYLNKVVIYAVTVYQNCLQNHAFFLHMTHP